MRCPMCGHNEARVWDSRAALEGRVIRRRRECLSCFYRFTTREEVEQPELRVRKRDGSCQLFDMAKVSRGVWRALEKREIPSDQVERLLRDIEEGILGVGRERKEMSSEAIGTIVLDHLRRCDSIAYLRFASVYKQFETIEQFLREIHSIIAESQADDGVGSPLSTVPNLAP